MIKIKTILCPVDFFPASDAAVNYAAGLAARYDAAVHLLHVVTPVAAGTNEYAIDTTDIMRCIQKRSMDEINELLARIKRTGIAAKSELRVGDVYQEIKAAIDDLSPDLIVMGTHGRRGVEHWFVGSTTEKLLRHTPVPLVTISAASEKSWNEPRFRKILVTTDFSDGTPDALSYAFSVAQENESLVVLLHVIQDKSADDLSGKYRDSLTDGVRRQLEDLVPVEATNWCDIVTRVDIGVPYRIILRTIEDERPDLLVMNIHGKSMLDRALLGSTAERVVRAAACPVMMIPPIKRKLKRKARPGGSRVAS
jgi:nucleotide-binding universal stress UspA family protein